jgi:hypothetical protein
MASAPVLSAVARQYLYAVMGVSALAALLVGLRWHRPAAPGPWRLFIAGVTSSLGAAVWWTFELVLTGELGFASVGDFLYFSVYPFIIAGLATWVRRDRTRPGYESVVDASLVVSGLLTLSWTFVMAPMLAHAYSLGHRMPGYLLYTVMDLIIVAMAVRLIFSAGVRTVSYLLMVTAAFTLLAGDCVSYILTAHNDNGAGSSLASPLWIVTYLLLGAAALHLRWHGRRGSSSVPSRSRRRCGSGCWPG